MNFWKKISEKLKFTRESTTENLHLESKKNSLSLIEDDLNKEMAIIFSNDLNLINEVINFLEYEFSHHDEKIRSIKFSVNKNDQSPVFDSNLSLNFYKSIEYIDKKGIIKKESFKEEKYLNLANVKAFDLSNLNKIDCSSCLFVKGIASMDGEVSFDKKKGYYKYLLHDYFSKFEKQIISHEEIENYCETIEEKKPLLINHRGDDFILLSPEKDERYNFNMQKLFKTEINGFNTILEKISDFLFEKMNSKVNLNVLFNIEEHSEVFCDLHIKLIDGEIPVIEERVPFLLLNNERSSFFRSFKTDLVFKIDDVISRDSFDPLIMSIGENIFGPSEKVEKNIKYKKYLEYLAEQEKKLIGDLLTSNENQISNKRRI